MKFIEPSVTLLKKPEDQTNEAEVLKYIERIGRVCYRSEDKITEDSAKKFFLMLKNRGHWAMLEHFQFTVFVTMGMYCDVFERVIRSPFISVHGSLENTFKIHYFEPSMTDMSDEERKKVVEENPFLKNNQRESIFIRVQFSPRAYLEFYNNNYRDLKYDPEHFPEHFNVDRFNYALKTAWPTIFEDLKSSKEYDDNQNYIYIPKKVHRDDDNWLSMEFVTSRSIANEIVRHRVASYAQESTRYCNYSKGKFGSELTFIKHEFPELSPYDAYMNYEYNLRRIEESYMHMIEHGVSPQRAREILPNSLATKIVMTASDNEWLHFFELRCSPDAHPDMRVVANMAKEIYLSERGFIE